MKKKYIIKVTDSFTHEYILKIFICNSSKILKSKIKRKKIERIIIRIKLE